MIWTQALLSFVVWIATGFILQRNSAKIGCALEHLSSTARRTVGVVGFLGSLALLIGGLYGIQALGGILKGQLTPIGWIAATVLGVVFVTCQSLTAGAMIIQVQLGEPGTRVQASDIQNGKEHE